MYTYHWGRGRLEGDYIPIAGEEGDRREIIYLLLGKREMGGRLYTYCWQRVCIPNTREEGDGREIVYLLLGKREIVYLTLGKREIGGRLYT